MGKSGAGKDRTLKELIKQGFHKIPTVTTRPQRIGEANGKDYIFTNDYVFRSCIDEGLFAEYRMYNATFGDWWYGSLKSSYLTSTNEDAIILTPGGYTAVKSFLDKNNVKPIVFMICANYDVRRQRLEQRGDHTDEIIRRMKEDDIDFACVDYIPGIHKIWNNGDIQDTVKQIINIVNEVKCDKRDNT